MEIKMMQMITIMIFIISIVPCVAFGFTVQEQMWISGYFTNLTLTVTPIGLTATLLKYDKKLLTSSIPTSIGFLTAATNLDVYQNFLTGTIPTEIGLLKDLNYHDCDQNAIMGTIPTQFGYLNKLTMLWLDNNKLSSTIPTQFGYLVKLSTLAFTFGSSEKNFIHGTLPSQIGYLTNLKTLYLAKADLSGAIPSSIGNMPNTWSNLALNDNPRLCSGPDSNITISKCKPVCPYADCPCTDYACPPSFEIRPSSAYIVCQSINVCLYTECCQPAAGTTCQTHSCAVGVSKSAAANINCPGTVCTDGICCDMVNCASHSCVTGTLKGAPVSIICSNSTSNTCDDSICCNVPTTTTTVTNGPSASSSFVTIVIVLILVSIGSILFRDAFIKKRNSNEREKNKEVLKNELHISDQQLSRFDERRRSSSKRRTVEGGSSGGSKPETFKCPTCGVHNPLISGVVPQYCGVCSSSMNDCDASDTTLSDLPYAEGNVTIRSEDDSLF